MGSSTAMAVGGMNSKLAFCKRGAAVLEAYFNLIGVTAGFYSYSNLTFLNGFVATAATPGLGTWALWYPYGGSLKSSNKGKGSARG